jgi:hypothetical protein
LSERTRGVIRLSRCAAGLLVCLGAGGLAAIALSSTADEASAAYYYYCPGGGAGGIYGYCPPTTTTTTTPQPGTLRVIKHVVNDNSGTSAAADFTINVTGTSPTPSTFPGAESPGTNVTITAGSYSVTETGPAGYVGFFSAGCSGTIAAGQTKTCTITNNDIAPRLTQGYWKTHADATTALLPQTLGSYAVITFADAQAVFNAGNCSSSKAGDLIGCLAAQLLAAKLNLANASDPCIQPTVTKAGAFLSGGTVTAGGVTATGITYTGPGTYTLSASQRAVAETLKDALDKYNNNKKGCLNP